MDTVPYLCIRGQGQGAGMKKEREGRCGELGAFKCMHGHWALFTRRWKLLWPCVRDFIKEGVVHAPSKDEYFVPPDAQGYPHDLSPSLAYQVAGVSLQVPMARVAWLALPLLLPQLLPVQVVRHPLGD